MGISNMHILVQTVTGKNCGINVVDTTPISELNAEIENVMGIPSESQKLIFNGKKLESEMTVSDYMMEEESCVHLVVSLDGGAKGKKKKKMVKKTKKPHKHRKNKLAILSYYKVEGENVVRLRQQCKLCPPGTYLADHEERLYCGRCHHGYKKTGEIKKKVKKVVEKKEEKKEEKVEDKKGKKGKKK